MWTQKKRLAIFKLNVIEARGRRAGKQIVGKPNIEAASYMLGVRMDKISNS